jgi:hypothetical protein
MSTIDDLPVMSSVPVYFKVVFGGGATAAYDAAKRGDIPTVRIGGKVFVPVRRALQPLMEDGADITPILIRLRDAERAKGAS